MKSNGATLLLIAAVIGASLLASVAAQQICTTVGFDSACGSPDGNATCGITCNGTHCINAVDCGPLGMACQNRICVSVIVAVTTTDGSQQQQQQQVSTCTSDSQCPTNQTCFNGTCSIVIGGGAAAIPVAPTPAAAPLTVIPCSQNSDCAVGSQVCRQGACVPFLSCSNDLQCSDGLICQNGGCQSPILCATSSQCPSSHVCNVGRCVILVQAGFPVLGGGQQTATTVITTPTNSGSSSFVGASFVIGASVLLTYLL